ncbi:hypothetical protein Tco_1255336 [Tanacetum coccineum]
MQVQETIVEEEVKEFGIKSLGDVPLDEFCGADAYLDADESPFCWAAHLESSLAQQVADKIKDSVPILVVDAFEERLDKNDVNLRKLSTQENIELVITVPAPAQGEQQPINNTPEPTTAEEEKADAQGEQSSKQAPPISTALVVHSSEEKGSEEKPTKDEPPFKKLRILVPNLNIPSPTSLKSLMPQGIRPPVVINMPLDQFTYSLFNTTSSEFSLTLFKDDKAYLEKKMTLEEAKAQMEEIKRLEFLKTEKEKSEKRLKVLTPEELEAQAAELTAYEAKRAKILQEYNHCITFRANPLPITKISYKVMGFSEWIEVHALASKVRSKSNGLLLKNLKAKFQWVKTQAAKLGIPSPPQLTVFELPPAKRKVGIKRKKRYELIHEVFVMENIIVDGMQRNLTLLKGVVGKAGMVIKEPEARIFLYNGNFDLVFQRRSEYALASTPQLIRIQNLIKIDSEYAQHVYDELIYEINYACSDSPLLTPLCCDDIHDVTPRVSALAGCDRLVSEPLVIENYVSLIRKKFRWGTIFLIGLKRYRDPKEEPIEKEPLMELKEIG